MTVRVKSAQGIGAALRDTIKDIDDVVSCNGFSRKFAEEGQHILAQEMSVIAQSIWPERIAVPQPLVDELFESDRDAVGDPLGCRIGTVAYQGTQTFGLGNSIG
jgi:hypothetical protein